MYNIFEFSGKCPDTTEAVLHFVLQFHMTFDIHILSILHRNREKLSIIKCHILQFSLKFLLLKIEVLCALHANELSKLLIIKQ